MVLLTYFVVPHAGSGVARIDLLRFLARWRKRWLNQVQSVSDPSMFFYCEVYYGLFLCIFIFFGIYSVFWLFWLSFSAYQVIG